MYKRIVLKLSGETLAPEKIPAGKGFIYQPKGSGATVTW